MVVDTTPYTLRTRPGFGVDVTTDREDELDKACLATVDQLVAAKAGAAPVLALDIGGGHGAMSVKMAKHGADVTLIDPLTDPIHLANSSEVRHKIRHLAKLIAEWRPEETLGIESGQKIDIIFSQRMLSYLPYSEALQALKHCREHASRNCKIFLSVGGVDSPLGVGYNDQNYPIDAPERHARLNNEEAAHIGVTEPVTFYRPAELQALLEKAGFKNVHIFLSPRGMLKATAENELATERNPRTLAP